MVQEERNRATAVDISELRFSWRNGTEPDLEIDCLKIMSGERLFIQGASGSGKSTLLNLMAGVITPQKGNIKVNGHTLNTLDSAARDRFRADNIGYIYQMKSNRAYRRKSILLLEIQECWVTESVILFQNFIKFSRICV